jgi:hypothetical protein
MKSHHESDVERVLKVALAREFAADQPLISVSRSGESSPIELGPACILCGTDLSDDARHAVEVAAAIAKRGGDSLVLVHAVNDGAQENLPGELRESLSFYARSQLREGLGPFGCAFDSTGQRRARGLDRDGHAFAPRLATPRPPFGVSRIAPLCAAECCLCARSSRPLSPRTSATPKSIEP